MKALLLRNSAAVLAVATALSAMAKALPELKSDEQLHLLRTINLALRNYTATTQAKAVEAVYRVNLDMVKEMSALDRRTVLAEVFATVPDFALPAVADGFARDLFCRETAGFNSSDDSFTDFAISAMLRIYRRCSHMDLTGQRRTVFAAIMFLKVSGGEPPDLQSQLEAFIPDPIRNMARDLWIPAALGDSGWDGTYEPLLRACTNDVAISRAGLAPQQLRVRMRWPASEQGMTLVCDQLDRVDPKRSVVPELDEDCIGVNGSGMTILPWAQFSRQDIFYDVFSESGTVRKKGAQ